MSYTISKITKTDDLQIENVIRACLIEFGADHEGTAWADPNLCRFSEIYNTDGNAYWVAKDESKRVVGGVGIGAVHGETGICELQKMYLLPEARGTGLAQKLLETAIDYAKQYYSSCYLETLDNMKAAQRFYEKHGFMRIYSQIGNTGHYACDVRYIKYI